MKIITSLTVIAVVGLSHSTAIAVPTVIDFNDAVTGGLFTDPYNEDGFQIEVLKCHYDIVSGSVGANPIDGTTWMGFDRSGCGDYSVPAQLRLHRFGGLFNLLSLDVVSGEGWTSLVSSNGASVVGCATLFGPCTGELSLTGVGWRVLTYVDFFSAGDPGAPVGFDNIRLTSIPEPGTLALFGVGLAALGLVRRKERSA